jgi:hypothetical protein
MLETLTNKDDIYFGALVDVFISYLLLNISSHNGINSITLINKHVNYSHTTLA